MLLQEWSGALPPLALAFLRNGYLAVEIFFILSGFVLARSYGAVPFRTRDLRNYAAGRFSRVYPVYILSLILVSPYIASAAVASKTSLIANYVLLLQGWTGRLPINWNTPAWSLSCEIFFYLCFPFAAAVLTRLNLRATLLSILAICLLPAALGLLHVPPTWKPLIHLADFLIGICSARGFSFFGPSWRGRGAWLYLPGMAALLALFLYPVHVSGWLDRNGVLRPFMALTLLGLALSGGWVARFLSLRLPVFLGKASYSLYILHIPLLWSFMRWSPYWFPGVPKGLVACVFAAAAVAISAAVFQFVEEPANLYLRGLLTGAISPPPIWSLVRTIAGIPDTPDSDSPRSSTCAPAS